MTNIEDFSVLNLIINPSKSHIDVEGSRPAREWVKSPRPIIVLNSDTPSTLRLSYYILGELDAC